MNSKIIPLPVDQNLSRQVFQIAEELGIKLRKTRSGKIHQSDLNRLAERLQRDISYLKEMKREQKKIWDALDKEIKQHKREGDAYRLEQAKQLISDFKAGKL